MRRITFAIWLLLVIVAVLLIGVWSPVQPSSAQVVTPTVTEESGPTATPGLFVGGIMRLWLADGTYQDFVFYPAGMAIEPTREVIETPLPTALPPTSTPTATPSPTLTPTVTATPLPLCTGTTTAALNFRAGPGTSYAILQDLTQTPPVNIVFPKGAVIPINGWTQTGGAIWLKTVYKAQAGWVSAAYVTLSAGCKQEFPDYPF